MTEQQIDSLFQHVRAWPKEDQDELVQAARDIEARRSGVYHATPEELAAIDEAKGVAEDAEVEAAFRIFRSDGDPGGM